jgi:ribosomal protein L12E/L44/L45/RPP1/RPP2
VAAELVDRLNANSEFVTFYRELPTTTKSEISTGCLHAFLKRQGFKGFKDFKTTKTGQARWKNRTYGGVALAANHKVISVTFDGYEDVYNLDVEKYHNFALTAGVFTHNTGKLDLKFDPLSQDEDFFVPTRKGTDGARIDVLGAPAWQHMDDIEYFRDKLFAALKVPKAYLAQDQNVNRAALSSEDVRFARTVLRVQRELRNGFAKIARVHLAAIGIDPARVEYDIHMTTPSSIFELAQLEVRNAKADLAGRMNEFVSLHWILSKIFGLSDKEIEEIIKERKEDVKRTTSAAAEAEAEAQKLLQPQQPDAGGEVPFPGQEPAQGEPGQEPEPAEARVQPKYGITERLKRRTASVRRMPITERELFHGSREAEKRAGEKYEKLLQNDQMLAKRMDELGGFLRDLKGAKWRK